MVDGVNGVNGLFGQAGATATGARPASGYDGPRYSEPRDRVTLSARGKQNGDKTAAGTKDERNLSAEEKQQVEELKRRDIEVKAHEQAHMAAGGGIVQGGASYQYEHGPDGKTYAVGGEVKIDASPERTPEATIRKMQQVQRAALAPAQPSGTDRAVAARAAQVEAQARLQKVEENDQTSEPQEGQSSAEPAEAGAGKDGTDITPATPEAGPDRSDAGTIAPKDARSLFAYKADLSPNPNTVSKARGLKIDLVA